MKIVYGRNELGLSTEEEDELVELSDNCGTNVPIDAFPEEMQKSIRKKEGYENEDFSIDVMDFQEKNMNDEQEWDAKTQRCDECGGLMEWCDCCEMWTQICCVDYGTCMCSQENVWNTKLE